MLRFLVAEGFDLDLRQTSYQFAILRR